MSIKSNPSGIGMWENVNIPSRCISGFEDFLFGLRLVLDLDLDCFVRFFTGEF